MINKVNYSFNIPYYDVDKNGNRIEYCKQEFTGSMFIYTEVDPYMLPDMIIEKHDLPLDSEIDNLVFNVVKL